MKNCFSTNNLLTAQENAKIMAGGGNPGRGSKKRSRRNRRNTRNANPWAIMIRQIDHVSQRVDRVEQRLDRLEQRIDRLDQKIDHVNQKIDGLRSEVKQDIERVDNKVAAANSD
ncbi:MAG: hypothetical protein AB1652_02215 [Bacillota bacterium]